MLAFRVLISSFIIALCRGDIYHEQEYNGNLQTLVRKGNVAAHVMLSSADDIMQRFLIAMHAQNSGAFLEFNSVGDESISIRQIGEVEIQPADGSSNVVVKIGISGPTRIHMPVVGSIRTVRDYIEKGILHFEEVNSKLPFEYTMTANDNEALTEKSVDMRSVKYTRKFFDGITEMTLEVSSEGDARMAAGDSWSKFAENKIGLRNITISAPQYPALLSIRTILNDVAPEALPITSMLQKDYQDDGRAPLLEFLTSEAGWVAGTWRFLTYFGRDTLLTLFLMQDILMDDIVEKVLKAAISRVDLSGTAYNTEEQSYDSEGFACHEDTLGDYAGWLAPEENKPMTVTMMCDYKMVDTDLLILPVLIAWASKAPERATEFLKETSDIQLNYGIPLMTMLLANIDHVLRLTKPFADDSTDYKNLIPIRHETLGNWRDSDEGLGWSIYAMDVNAALAPASLRAIENLSKLGIINSGYSQKAGTMAKVWEDKALEFMKVKVYHEVLEANLLDYVQNQEANEQTLVGSLALSRTEDLPESFFIGLGLDKGGHVAPVLNTDLGFLLAFRDNLELDVVKETARAVKTPFPRGLHTGAGMVVANPGYLWRSGYELLYPGLTRLLSCDAYHGTVVWAWQSFLMMKGLNKWKSKLQQMNKVDSLADEVDEALGVLLRELEANFGQSLSEMWGFSYDPSTSHFIAKDFGSSHGGTEGNVVQLWSFASMVYSRQGSSSFASHITLPTSGSLLISLFLLNFDFFDFMSIFSLC